LAASDVIPGERQAAGIKIDDSLSAIPGTRVRNLEVFAIVGPDQIPKRDYLTLSEALARNLVRLTETANVNELKIRNKSEDRYVFIEAGDIVKGGQQDRCIGTDMILSPKSGNHPIGSFCVEAGRWTRRAGESAADFSKSDKLLVTSSQRYAAKAAKAQTQVWNEVDKSKKALSGNLSKLGGPAVNVEDNVSPSSLQLALENPKLNTTVGDMRAKIAKSFPHRPDIIGLAYAVNGKLVNAEIYGNAKLFAKLRDKLIEAAATEAIVETQEIQPAPISEKALRDFLAPETLRDAKKSQPNTGTECREREEPNRALFETRDLAFKGTWCHRNVIIVDQTMKSGSAPAMDLNQAPQR
jgi:hypothetical protein